MKIKLVSLKLLCRQSEEFIRFGSKISFFHGRMSSGKSTIVELVNYCLGGKLVNTPAISSEAIKAQLTVVLGNKQYLLERTIPSSEVDVSWEDDDGVFRETLPLTAGTAAIIEPDIFNLSDFLLTRMGITPIKVRKRKGDEDSDMHRLSFRDFYQFCYLDQPHLDSSLFYLDQPIRSEKSKDVLKYMLGFQSDRLTTLQRELQEKRQNQRTLRDAAKQISTFLAEYGFDSEGQIDSQVSRVNREIEKLELEKKEQDSAGREANFLSDELREKAQRLANASEDKNRAVLDIRERINEQESLSAELITLKLKAARASTATTLLEGAGFHSCPSCGTQLEQASDPGTCSLCKSPLAEGEQAGPSTALIEQDLSDRIDDLKISLRRLRRSLVNQERQLDELLRQRKDIQSSIDEARRSIESEYLQRARKIESELGKLKERRRFLMKVRAMPSEIEKRLDRADRLNTEILKTQRLIEEEEAKFEVGRKNLRVLERNFLEILRAIHFPEITAKDRVQINTRTWMPYIYPDGKEQSAWTFSDVGSGGKTVLFKICFGLAVHKTAATEQLSLPTIFIVDSTMKNITPDINREVFDNFYQELYRLLLDELSLWQCIIVDQTFSPLDAFETGAIERQMTVDDDDHPPLIGYYRGH